MKNKIVAFFIIILFVVSAQANEAYSSLAFERELFKEPLITYQLLIKQAPNSENKESYLWWLLRKAQAEQLLYFYPKFEATILDAERLINTESPLLIQSLFNLFQGILYRNKGEYKKSSNFISLALEQAKRGGNEAAYIHAKQENAYTQSLAELFETSLSDIQEAYVKAYSLKDEFLIASINETYGAIYGYMYDYEKSINYYNKALTTYERLGYQAHVAEAVYGLASTYRYWKKFDLAIENFERYRQLSRFTPNKDISFYAAYGLGMTLAEQGSCSEALVIINQALQQKGVVDYNSELYKNKAVCLLQLGKVSEATQALNNAKLIFAQLPDLIGTTWELETLKIESQIGQANKSYQLSYQLLEEYHKKYTEVLINSSSERLLQVRADMELERQKVEKALALQRSKVVSLKEKTLQQKSNQQQYFLFFLAIILIIAVFMMIFQRRSNQKMRLLSITDPLSGLYNRRYIFSHLDKLLANMSPSKGDLAVILLDIDDFKKVNDDFGHPTGDFIIQKVAEIGQEVLRAGDVMARIGGEEFLCVLPRATDEQAENIAERMLAAIARQPFNSQNKNTIKITVSIGIASYGTECQSYDVLYDQADKALYQAKVRGKNCIVIG